MNDVERYNRDRSFTVDDGPVKCSSPTGASTWNFAANETEMVLGSSSYRNKIVSLTATTLQLEISESYPGGTSMVQTTTYVVK